MKRRGRRPPPKPPALGLDAEEQELFLRAYYTGVVDTQEPAIIKPEPTISPQVIELLSQDEKELFLQTVAEGMSSSKANPPKPKEQFFLRKYQSKKRGSPDASVDLHGMVAEEAVQVLLEFINREKARGSKNLLVVHGKGAGILRNAVWAVIETHSSVDDFQVAPAKFGGGGALIVRINRKVRR